MGKSLVVIVLISVLAVSLFLNVALYYQNYSVTREKEDFTAYYNEFGNVSLQSISYNFSPPVSMYHALKIALDSDGWNTASLENKIVSASLEYREFYNDSIIIKNPYDNTTAGPGKGAMLLHSVTQPVKDYSAVTVQNATYTTTYRYIWDIVVKQNAGVTIPPPGLYWVDAATAEIIPTGPLF
jgi:type II secretory pathway pseudopilin PulG